MYSFFNIPLTMAQESITITGSGCSACNQVTNKYFVDWDWTGDIPYVSIYYYNLSMTYLEYTITGMTINNGTYEWQLPISHQLDGQYNLVVCDYSNHEINDTVTRNVYPVTDNTSMNISGYSLILIGLMIGIIVIPLTIKLRER